MVILERVKANRIGNMRMRDIERKDIEAFSETMKETGKYSNKTINKNIDLIKATFKLALQNEYIYSNPSQYIKHLSEDHFEGDYYSIPECQQLFDCVQHRGDYRLIATVYLGILNGLRRGEICGLRWDNVHFSTTDKMGCIFINESNTQAGTEYLDKKTKTEKSVRWLTICPEVEKVLKKYKEHQDSLGIVCDYVLTDDRGERVNPAYLSVIFQELLERYGLRHIRLHDLRHTYCSIAYQSDAPLIEVSKSMGHATLKTTQEVYTHLSQKSNDIVTGKISTALFKSPNGD
jgi:integrase